MDEKQLIQSYREEVNKLRLKLSRLEVNSVEQKASDEVRKWRQTFNTSSAIDMDRILNEIEKRKQSEVSSLVNELRILLDEFKEATLKRLAELDLFIVKINLGDEIQLDYVKFELDSITKKVDSLHMDILVTKIDTSRQRRSSTALARNNLEMVKVFEFRNPQSAEASSSGFMDPLMNFVRRASVAGAGYYSTGALDHRKYF